MVSVRSKFVSLLFVIGALLAATIFACSLNPQPLPPGVSGNATDTPSVGADGGTKKAEDASSSDSSVDGSSDGNDADEPDGDGG